MKTPPPKGYVASFFLDSISFNKYLRKFLLELFLTIFKIRKNVPFYEYISPAALNPKTLHCLRL